MVLLWKKLSARSCPFLSSSIRTFEQKTLLPQPHVIAGTSSHAPKSHQTFSWIYRPVPEFYPPLRELKKHPPQPCIPSFSLARLPLPSPCHPPLKPLINPRVHSPANPPPAVVTKLQWTRACLVFAGCHLTGQCVPENQSGVSRIRFDGIHDRLAAVFMGDASRGSRKVSEVTGSSNGV
jgi:hypothetical protein